jgi:hypothetical protein
MPLFLRVYFNALFGALGGLIGWMLFGAFGDKHSTHAGQWLLGGAVVGGFIGYFIVSVEAIRDRSLVRFSRLASYGLLLGAAGGALGMALGEIVNYALVSKLIDWLGPGRQGASAVGRVLGEVLSRALGWLLLGAAVGLSEGIAARSRSKLIYGTLGGALGGLIGGALYGLVKALEREPGSAFTLWGEALGLMILGAAIGALSALVQAVFQPASVRVMRGWQEGREYPLLKDETILGRDEHADIALFRDMRIEKQHALIRRRENRYELANRGAPAEHTRVNDLPVADRCPLHDGDRLQLGNVVLRFQIKSGSPEERQKQETAHRF